MSNTGNSSHAVRKIKLYTKISNTNKKVYYNIQKIEPT